MFLRHCDRLCGSPVVLSLSQEVRATPEENLKIGFGNFKNHYFVFRAHARLPTGGPNTITRDASKSAANLVLAHASCQHFSMIFSVLGVDPIERLGDHVVDELQIGRSDDVGWQNINDVA